MSGVLLDTHVWSWTLTDTSMLSVPAVDALEAGPTKFVSPVTFYEIAQKVRLGKWPQMDRFVGTLIDIAEEQEIVVTPLLPEIALIAGLLKWDHRDPFDRMLAATALMNGLDLISADTAFDQVAALRRIW